MRLCVCADLFDMRINQHLLQMAESSRLLRSVRGMRRMMASLFKGSGYCHVVILFDLKYQFNLLLSIVNTNVCLMCVRYKAKEESCR
jgi:hypothetical protein